MLKRPTIIITLILLQDADGLIYANQLYKTLYNRFRNRNHIIISKHAGKSFDHTTLLHVQNPEEGPWKLLI